MKTLYELCIPRESVFDETKRDDTLDLTNLIDGRIDVDRFIKETYITQGMEQLLDSAFRRFKRKGATGLVKLTQAMGGGKTHSMITLGLLANYPELRKKVLGGKFDDDQVGKIKVVAFTGRESDTPYGIWGSIAEQLGKKEQFSEYYSPLRAPGQSAWINLLKGEPLLIMLDELPPYLDYARSITIGNSDLSSITTTALSNLFTAINKEELSNVCLVISDLKAAYEWGSELIQSTFKDLENEVNRSAISVEPVNNATDEVYYVLKKRLFEELPPEEEVVEVANGYKKAVKDAKQIGYTNISPDEIYLGVKDSYPFHPALRDLYARFRENEGFQQTRGLIKLMRQILVQLYSGDEPDAKNKYLIGVYDFDLNDHEMFSMVKEIKPSLMNAITHDIASDGKAVAEMIDKRVGGTVTRDLAKLILVSSLSDIPGALLGLSLSELIGYVCEPDRDISASRDRLEEFKTRAWYLFVDNDGKLLFKHVKNLNAQVSSLADSYDNESAKKEIREFLSGKFRPSVGDCYQKVLVFPSPDDVELSRDQVTMLLTEPYIKEGGLHPEMRKLFDEAVYKNRILFLTGQRNTMENLLQAAKTYRAVNSVIDEMKSEKYSESDPQYQHAVDRQHKATLNFLASARETFVTLFYPAKDNKLLQADFLMEFSQNKFNGEDQVRKVLIERRKLETETADDNFRRKCEERLFTRKEMLWREIKERAATNTSWQWHHPDALDKLKDDMLAKGIWRENGGYIEKPPFPKEKTTVQVNEISRNDDTGEVILKLLPRYGDRVHYEIDEPATTASMQVEDPNNFKTSELKLYFLCVDSTGEHETGDPVEWTNRITLKYDFYNDRNGNLMMRLHSAPPAEIRYTTDGSGPKENGARYVEDFIVPDDATYVLAVGVAEKKGIYSEVLEVKVPKEGGPKGLEIYKDLPLVLNKKYQTSDTKQTYESLDNLKDKNASLGDFTVTLTREDGGWFELTSGPDTLVDPSVLEEQMKSLREAFTKEEDAVFTLEYRKIRFPSGQDFLDWVEDNKLELNDFRESEVDQ